MKGHFLTSTKINMFRKYLQEEEKSGNTLEKYIRDVTAFFKFWTGAITKDTVNEWRETYYKESRQSAENFVAI